MSPDVITPQEIIRGCHGSHLAAWLPALQPGTIERLAAAPRLAERLHRMLAAGLPPLPPMAPSGPLERLALRTAGEVAEAERWMGALCHARVIGLRIAADEIAVLEQAVGRDARRFALRHAAAIEGTFQAPATTGSVAELAARLVEDGQRCIVRWLELVAPPFQALAALRLPLDRPPAPGSFGCQADPVILRVAEAFADAG